MKRGGRQHGCRKELDLPRGGQRPRHALLISVARQLEVTWPRREKGNEESVAIERGGQDEEV